MKYVHIYGTEATIYVNLTTNSLTLLKNRRLPRALARGMRGIEEGAQLLGSTVANAARVATGRLRPYPGMGVLIAEFYRCIAEDGPSPVDSAAGPRGGSGPGLGLGAARRVAAVEPVSNTGAPKRGALFPEG